MIVVWNINYGGINMSTSVLNPINVTAVQFGYRKSIEELTKGVVIKWV